MPVEMLKDCIGQEVVVCVEGELGGFDGTVLEIQENWIKVETKSSIRYVNGDMISQIYIKKKK